MKIVLVNAPFYLWHYLLKKFKINCYLISFSERASLNFGYFLRKRQKIIKEIKLPIYLNKIFYFLSRKKFIKILKKKNIDKYFFPNAYTIFIDEFSILLAKRRKKFLIPNFSLYFKIIRKDFQYKLLKKFKLNFPSKCKKFPCFIKPNISAGGYLAKKVENRREKFKTLNSRIYKEKSLKPLIQEYIRTKKYVIANFFCYNGKIIDGFVVSNISKKNEKMMKKIKNCINKFEKLVKYLNWNGFISFQSFIKNNKIIIIEINPRVTHFLPDVYLLFDWKKILNSFAKGKFKSKIRFLFLEDFIKNYRLGRRVLKVMVFHLINLNILDFIFYSYYWLKIDYLIKKAVSFLKVRFWKL